MGKKSGQQQDENQKRLNRIRRRLQAPVSPERGKTPPAFPRSQSTKKSKKPEDEDVVELVPIEDFHESDELAERSADNREEEFPAAKEASAEQTDKPSRETASASDIDLAHQVLMERYRRLKQRLEAAIPWRGKYETILNSCLQTVSDLDEALEILDQADQQMAVKDESSDSDESRAVFTQRIADGIRYVRDRLLDTLQQQEEVSRIEPLLGDPVDPTRHEVVDCMDGDDLPEGTIGEIVEFGYSRAGVTIRPARVRVVKSR